MQVTGSFVIVGPELCAKAEDFSGRRDCGLIIKARQIMFCTSTRGPEARLGWIMRAALLVLVSGLMMGTLGQAQELTGIAVLPARSFVQGPSSGQFIEPANGVSPPFVGQQPVQGLSALLYRDGRWLSMTDNGFGSQTNSADYLLRVLELQPDFRRQSGGAGQLGALSLFTLCDPDRQIRFPVVADRDFYPGSTIPVATEIRQRRCLTGADLDIESFQQAPDNSFWFGDEFGPFLLHTDQHGIVLEPPFPLPGVMAPENPFLGATAPAARSSGGFESLAISPDGRWLYAMLEKPKNNQPGDRLAVYRFDILNKVFNPLKPVWHYPLEDDKHRVGALLMIDWHRFFTVERDRLQGNQAGFKRIYEIKVEEHSDQPLIDKSLLLDLLAIPDPAGLASAGGLFRYPFATIEGLARYDQQTLAVLNDNNFPFSLGRHLDSGEPDDSELILLRIEDLR